MDTDKSYNYNILAQSALKSFKLTNKYYNLLKQSPAYYAAIVLDPRVKMSWFKDTWGAYPKKKDWINGAKLLLNALWT